MNVLMAKFVREVKLPPTVSIPLNFIDKTQTNNAHIICVHYRIQLIYYYYFIVTVIVAIVLR